MRQKSKQSEPEGRAARKEPLAEAIVPEAGGRRNWAAMDDRRLLAYARKVIRENRLRNRSGLKKADDSLYQALLRRGLMGELTELPGRRTRSWAKMSHRQLLDTASRLMLENGIRNRSGLSRSFGGLYYTLRRRNLLDQLAFPGEERRWVRYSDERLLSYARAFMERERIRSPVELEQKDGGLYMALLSRKLHLKLRFASRRASFADKSDQELLDLARRSIREKGHTRSTLAQQEAGLYLQLRKRGLLEATGLPNQNEGDRDWASMDDQAIIDFTLGLIRVKGVRYKSSLKEVDHGLYSVLRNRGLLSRLGLQTGSRRWPRYSDGELVDIARGLLKEKGIASRKDLERADPSFYQTLRRRGLLDAVFSDIENSKEADTLREIVRAMEEFR